MLAPLIWILVSVLPAAGLLGAWLVVSRRSSRSRPSDDPADLRSRRERRALVSALCSEIAHELSSTLVFLRDLVRHGQLEAEDRIIGQEQVARLEQLLSRLRATRAEPEARRDCNLSFLIREALGRIDLVASKRLRVGVAVEPSTHFRAGEASVQLLLVELLRNAAAAAPRGGHLEVRTRSGSAGLALEIEDDGPGLPAETSRTLFRPLATLGRGGSGTGIPLCARIAREHEWRLSTARERGRTVFRVEMPAPSAVAPHAEAGA